MAITTVVFSDEEIVVVAGALSFAATLTSNAERKMQLTHLASRLIVHAALAMTAEKSAA